MKFSVNQQDLQQALNYCQGVIEKRSTLPILSNVLLDVQKSKLTITATDLDLIFIHRINNIEVFEEGKITTISSLSGVQEFPMRIKCATMAWHTLLAALEKKG